jgi:hypothetical protein
MNSSHVLTASLGTAYNGEKTEPKVMPEMECSIFSLFVSSFCPYLSPFGKGRY